MVPDDSSSLLDEAHLSRYSETPCARRLRSAAETGTAPFRKGNYPPYPGLFNQVGIDPEVKTLVWLNGADFDPATLHDWPEHKEAFAARDGE